MGDSSGGPGPEEYVQAIERAFERCPNLSGLRLLSAEARLGFATVRFEGPAGDFRGPYGAMVRLPAGEHDELWTKHVDPATGTVEDWAHARIAMRAVTAHEASRDLERGYNLDGVWWIVNDAITTQ
ncbi:hypothetical protein [Arthrobacter sp. TMS2-4]